VGKLLFWGLTYRLTLNQVPPLHRATKGYFSTMRPMNLPVHKIRPCFAICGRVNNHSCIRKQLRRHARLLCQWKHKISRRCLKPSSTNILFSFPSAWVFCVFSSCVERNLFLYHGYPTRDPPGHILQIILQIIRPLTTGIRSEKCVVGDFVVVLTCTYTNLDSIGY
jgi:hypothetical protein